MTKFSLLKLGLLFFSLVGGTTIGLPDGTSHTFGPGDVRLIEDTTGKGHTTTYPDGLTITMQITPAKE